MLDQEEVMGRRARREGTGLCPSPRGTQKTFSGKMEEGAFCLAVRHPWRQQKSGGLIRALLEAQKLESGCAFIMTPYVCEGESPVPLDSGLDPCLSPGATPGVRGSASPGQGAGELATRRGLLPTTCPCLAAAGVHSRRQ